MKRLKPDDRRERIIHAACRLHAAGTSVFDLTREQVAKAADCSEGLVTHYFKMSELRQIIIDNDKT